MKKIFVILTAMIMVGAQTTHASTAHGVFVGSYDYETHQYKGAYNKYSGEQLLAYMLGGAEIIPENDIRFSPEDLIDMNLQIYKRESHMDSSDALEELKSLHIVSAPSDFEQKYEVATYTQLANGTWQIDWKPRPAYEGEKFLADENGVLRISTACGNSIHPKPGIPEKPKPQAPKKESPLSPLQPGGGLVFNLKNVNIGNSTNTLSNFGNVTNAANNNNSNSMSLTIITPAAAAPAPAPQYMDEVTVQDNPIRRSQHYCCQEPHYYPQQKEPSPWRNFLPVVAGTAVGTLGGELLHDWIHPDRPDVTTNNTYIIRRDRNNGGTTVTPQPVVKPQHRTYSTGPGTLGEYNPRVVPITPGQESPNQNHNTQHPDRP